MRIYYHCSSYISHRRAGAAYMDCLRQLGHDLADSPAHCDLIILHEEPPLYPEIVSCLPDDIVRIGYAVWETPQLPREYRIGVSLMDAVWTCSDFSRQAFAPHVPTFLLPHLVERPHVSSAAIRRVAQRLGIAEGGPDGKFLLYTITDSINPRKNLPALLTAFAAAFPGAPQDIRLVIKQYRSPQDLSRLPGVIDLPDTLDDEEIGALHALCNAYVSTHHAEAWGLPISEAMSFGNPVIATGYSGNMEFMNAENSFPIAYRIVPVSPAMCRLHPSYSADMRWADIDIAALVRTLRRIRRLPWTAADRTRVTASLGAFTRKAISARLAQLLARLPTTAVHRKTVSPVGLDT